jgi:hypothetical protein
MQQLAALMKEIKAQTAKIDEITAKLDKNIAAPTTPPLSQATTTATTTALQQAADLRDVKASFGLATPTHTTCSMESLSHDVDEQPSAAAIPNTTTSGLLPVTTLVHAPEVLAPITTSPPSPTAGMFRAADLDIVGVHVAEMSPRLEDVFRATPAIAVIYYTESLKLIVDSNLQTPTPTRCSSICFDDDMEVLAPMFRPDTTPSIMAHGLVLRPKPWPSFIDKRTCTGRSGLVKPTSSIATGLGRVVVPCLTLIPLLSVLEASLTLFGPARAISDTRLLSCEHKTLFPLWKDFSEFFLATRSTNVLQLVGNISSYPGGYLLRNRNRMTMLFITASSGSYWPVTCVIEESGHCFFEIAKIQWLFTNCLKMRTRCLVFLPFANLDYELWRPPDRTKSPAVLVKLGRLQVFLASSVKLQPWPSWLLIFLVSTELSNCCDSEFSSFASVVFLVGHKISMSKDLNFLSPKSSRVREQPVVLLPRDTTQLQSWPPPSGTQMFVPANDKKSWFNSWLVQLLFRDVSLQVSSDCHITATPSMNKFTVLAPGDDTKHGGSVQSNICLCFGIQLVGNMLILIELEPFVTQSGEPLPLLQPKPPWASLAPIHFPTEFKSNMRTNSESQRITGVLLEFTLFWVATYAISNSSSFLGLVRFWNPSGVTSPVWISQRLEEIAGSQLSSSVFHLPKQGNPGNLIGLLSWSLQQLPALLGYTTLTKIAQSLEEPTCRRVMVTDLILHFGKLMGLHVFELVSLIRHVVPWVPGDQSFVSLRFDRASADGKQVFKVGGMSRSESPSSTKSNRRTLMSVVSNSRKQQLGGKLLFKEGGMLGTSPIGTRRWAGSWGQHMGLGHL